MVGYQDQRCSDGGPTSKPWAIVNRIFIVCFYIMSNQADINYEYT